MTTKTNSKTANKTPRQSRLEKISQKQLKEIFDGSKLIIKSKGFSIKSVECQMTETKIVMLKTEVPTFEICDDIAIVKQTDMDILSKLKLDTEIKIIK